MNSIVESVLNDQGAAGPISFVPNSTFFKQTEQDLQIVMLVNNVYYTAPVNDSWFLATTPAGGTDGFGQYYKNASASNVGFGESYITDYYAASALTCMEQHAFCNPNVLGPASCTNLTGRSTLKKGLVADKGSAIQLNDWQWATTNRLLQTIDQISITIAIVELGASSLIAQNYLDYGFLDFTSSPLPAYQWKEEVTN